MSVTDIAGAAGSIAATYGVAAAKQGASTSAPKAAAGPAAGVSDSVSLGPLASTLRGESLSLFKELSVEDRTALNDIVSSGRMSAEDMHLALKDRVKTARNAAFFGQSRMFFNDPENADFIRSPDAITSDRLRGAMERQFAERDGVLKSMAALEEMGLAGTPEHERLGQILRGALTLDGDQPDPPSAPPFNGRLRIVAPFSRSLIDPRFTRTGGEKVAGETLESLGFASSSFDRAVRTVAEKDVTAYLRDQTDWLGGVMDGTPARPPRPTVDPDFRMDDIAGAVTDPDVLADLDARVKEFERGMNEHRDGMDAEAVAAQAARTRPGAELAAALKEIESGDRARGDTASAVFDRLADEDRAALAKAVASGALKAATVADGLAGLFKTSLSDQGHQPSLAEAKAAMALKSAGLASERMMDDLRAMGAGPRGSAWARR